ncbi:hypothetical protein SYNPS1DRAFT_25452 [Syncephalis pseudoplumigaleata]|uniref:Non-canonical E2 ubiquitin-conjugating enzyme C-terminal domain-containing protein n=1 Tax=Syncephalis pseudoplumigaleata TaxID=1712513 RepID=A0A4P9YSK8_9FUNG|nr:hypothetical protein SYNPS1DRAFT_25452 [Syncephalis pseudoplumigaleata]|eukprot:RKP22705.1 hypothetical protein SYNPS1DRAFT_25452 [Syncephalis pseudoplumigaleata]
MLDDPASWPVSGGKVLSSGGNTFGTWLLERTKYIPLRLNMEERKLLRLLESALNVSEYTDKIDILYYGNKVKRMVHQIKDICAILSGLLVASDYRAGQTLFAERTFQENAQFFSRIFEIGRRYKIMNPERMRSAYGKLMYMLQDSAIPEVQDTLEFSCREDIKTVYGFLEERKALALIADDYVIMATKEIIPEGKTRMAIQKEIRQKEHAIAVLSRKYASPLISPEDIQSCLYSIGDNHSYLRSNRDPCDKMLHYLTANFRPEAAECDAYSLAILSGRDGARLTHSHEQQYRYVHQTLSLWREILHEMFMLWWMADQDILSERTSYRLKDTGQGLNRVQPCPMVSKAVHRILHRAQQRAGHWIGSSVVHLGDKNVPNALMFIDKYNQVSRILGPLVACLGQLDRLAEYPGLEKYVRAYYTDVHECRKQILTDFFRYAFDGSGADNFFDAGSCIDGRLTSAWNWCSTIEKKDYYPVFLLTGFIGFDGEHFQ